MWREIGTAFSTTGESRMRRFFLLALFLVPILSLVAKVAALALHKVDIPVWDDWREFLRGRAGSFAPEDLFAPANNTIYATGKILDGLFIHLLNGNVVVYEVITASAVLGALLYLQYALLSRALENRLILAVAFFSTLLMLVPGTYWGRQYIAYHQALPLLSIVTIIHLALSERRRWTDAAVAALTLAAGFAYISGAFASLALALALVLHGRFLGAELRRPVVRTGVVVGVVGLVPLAAQLWVTLFIQPGREVLWVFPHEPEFWLFVLGKIGRAFSLPQDAPLLSLALTVANLGVILAAAVYLFRPIWLGGPASARSGEGHGASVPLQRLSVCFLGLAAAVGVYLAIVAVARTDMNPEAETTLLGAFGRGYLRFHFFWVTVLVPWFVAVVFTAVERLKGRRALTGLVPALALAILATALWGQGFNHFGFYEKQAGYQTEGLRCINQRVSRAARSIRCRNAHPSDLMRAYLRVAGSSLSFARYLPPPDNLPFMAEDAVLFSLAGPDGGGRIAADRVLIEPRDGALAAQVGRRSRLFVPLAAAAVGCELMQVTMRARLPDQSVLRVFWKAPGDTEWHNDRMYEVTLGSDPQSTTILLRSARGFAPTLRIDPSELSQMLVIETLEIGCLE